MLKTPSKILSEIHQRASHCGWFSEGLCFLNAVSRKTVHQVITNLTQETDFLDNRKGRRRVGGRKEGDRKESFIDNWLYKDQKQLPQG